MPGVLNAIVLMGGNLSADEQHYYLMLTSVV